jgi:hypothetical protein
MYEEFSSAVLRYEDYSYTIKKKFDSGTTVEMIFWVSEYDRLKPTVFVSVCLNTYTKRRQIDAPDFYFSSRGRDGLRPAIWATDLLLKFPEFLLDTGDFRHKNQVMYTIFWANSRRRDVYHKWLSRYGFYFDQVAEGRCLTKTFSRSLSV